ncbi:hypothetical protein BIY24_09870 [Halobacteriovorax marinus]|uniref:Exported protein n=1 Tax=Halobacteriovorax marinus (strain ATCC BAA-682 / DSM 15412 / SJ) TaxID=862908 RepID=E1X3I5_HALMS|nr:hypothetical protein [Halobacteriovorax marinus]ATH08246.1 hypothetical protein BIY24_09870 [Halobacteriovorax marinus]CBW26914.1 putative exported protein [Halobacteriovorax marinus SJ]
MLKDFIKIQIIALLILVMNAVATQDFKLIGKDESHRQGPIHKVTKKKEAPKKESTTLAAAHSPKEILLDALKKSLN